MTDEEKEEYFSKLAELMGDSISKLIDGPLPPEPENETENRWRVDILQSNLRAALGETFVLYGAPTTLPLYSMLAILETAPTPEEGVAAFADLSRIIAAFMDRRQKALRRAQSALVN